MKYNKEKLWYIFTKQRIPSLLAQHFQAPAKRSQHFSTTYPNIVGRNNAFGQPVATYCAMGIENRTSAHALV